MRPALVGAALIATLAGCDGADPPDVRPAPRPDRAECQRLTRDFAQLVNGSPDLAMHRRVERVGAALRRACGDGPITYLGGLPSS